MEFPFQRSSSLRVAGLMAGTSANGVDVAIIDITRTKRRVVAFDMVPYPAAICAAALNSCAPRRTGRVRIKAVCSPGG